MIFGFSHVFSSFGLTKFIGQQDSKIVVSCGYTQKMK